MIHPEREAQWERHYRATCTALFFYGLWWGEYPYEKVTVVDPAWGARAAVELSLASAKALSGALARAISAAEIEESERSNRSMP